MRAAHDNRLAIGFFDGVHLGHRAILQGARAALTFRQHPISVLAPEKAPRLLMSTDERVAAIRACGVQDVTVLDFTAELAHRTADEFVGFIRERFGSAGLTVRCGDNWRFGRGGAGDAEFLRAHGLSVEVVPYSEFRGEKVSSSRIRKCLELGRIEDAVAMLGHDYETAGTVVCGKGVGRALGYPTVNIDVGRPLSLMLGVYAVELAGARGVANYGFAPTMGADAWRVPTLEVHFLGRVPAALAERPVVTFLRFLRPERTFGSAEELARQIAADCEEALRVSADEHGLKGE